ncbi:MAG: polysaccharide deacetylase family protein [Caulobacter sp.]|nr:polysaccharide deacetylase family protein [Caulobacter sp.]
MSIERILIAALLGPELARWKAEGRAPVYWWRDDDARAPSPALDRLLELSRRFEAPVTLAAVPDIDLGPLARACEASGGVELAIHGFRHRNRAPEGRPSGEVNDQDHLTDIVAELATAIRAFRRAGVEPRLFVPPWNNAHPTLVKALALHGLELSCYGGMREEDSPARLDAHLDVMRWKPVPRFRGALKFLLRARRQLVERRLKHLWDEPVGLLTHHLDHDEPTWRFLEAFLQAARPTARAALGEAWRMRPAYAAGAKV